MKGMTGFICFSLIGICAGLAYEAANPHIQATMWERRVERLEKVEKLNNDLLYAQAYARDCFEAVRMLAVENGLLCEREAKMVQAMTIREEENRALKASLSEAVERLQEQTKQINELMEANSKLKWQVKTLEEALGVVEKADNDYMKVEPLLRFVPTVLSIVL